MSKLRYFQPVRCNFCGGIYDLGRVKVINRYADCSEWLTPCCKRRADSREDKSLPDYRRIVEPFIGIKEDYATVILQQRRQFE